MLSRLNPILAPIFAMPHQSSTVSTSKVFQGGSYPLLANLAHTCLSCCLAVKIRECIIVSLLPFIPENT